LIIPKPSPALFVRRPAPVLHPDRPITLAHHVFTMAGRKGLSLADVIAVLRRPDVTYPHGKIPSQVRYIGRGLCVVVDEDARRAVTVYLHKVETEMRPDQAGKAHVVEHFAARRTA